MATDYQRLLQHPKWQKRRLQIFERDHWKCVRCESDDKTLHVHHQRYVKGRLPWEYEDSELITLCDECHATQHGVDKHYRSLSIEGKIAFIRKLGGEEEGNARILIHGLFALVELRRDQGNCLIVYIPLFLFHGFSMSIEEAQKGLVEHPESVSDLKDFIINKAFSE